MTEHHALPVVLKYQRATPAAALNQPPKPVIFQAYLWTGRDIARATFDLESLCISGESSVTRFPPSV